MNIWCNTQIIFLHFTHLTHINYFIFIKVIIITFVKNLCSFHMFIILLNMLFVICDFCSKNVIHNSYSAKPSKTKLHGTKKEKNPLKKVFVLVFLFRSIEILSNSFHKDYEHFPLKTEFCYRPVLFLKYFM